MPKLICDKWTLSLFCLFMTEDASLLPCPKSSFQAQADRGRFIIDEYRNSANHSSVNRVDANLCFTTTIPRYVPLLSSNLSKLYFAQPKNLLVFFHRYIISQSYLVFFSQCARCWTIMLLHWTRKPEVRPTHRRIPKSVQYRGWSANVFSFLSRPRSFCGLLSLLWQMWALLWEKTFRWQLSLQTPETRWGNYTKNIPSLRIICKETILV